MKRVGIVLVNYNGAAFQNDCIRSLKQMNYKDIEIIVVDSGSTDNSVFLLNEEFDNIHLLIQNENIGVAKGNNIGIEYSKDIGCEFTLLLNNDTEVQSRLLDELIDAADEYTVVVPKIYFFDNKDLIWYGGGGIDWRKAIGYHNGLREKDVGQYDKMLEVDYSPTCCMLVHNSVFSRIGLIDENTFMYYDDTDFCVRMKECGVKLVYVPSAYMWHKVSSSSGGMQSKIGVYYNNRNKLYFIHKYTNRIRMVDKVAIYCKTIGKGILGLLKNNNNKYILTGFHDYLYGKTGRKDNWKS